MDYTILLFCFMMVLPTVTHAIRCGDYICTGTGPYCCTLSSGDIGCCWKSYVYQMWWFWFVWVIIFLIIMVCSAALWRRRRRTVRYTRMANSQYPAYGTVIHPGPGPAHAPRHNNPVRPMPPPTAPVPPPSYAAAEASKPPPYSG